MAQVLELFLDLQFTWLLTFSAILRILTFEDLLFCGYERKVLELQWELFFGGGGGIHTAMYSIHSTIL